MKKSMKIFIICAAGAILISALAVLTVVLLIRRGARNNILDGPGMVNEAATSVNGDNIIECEYSSRGGRSGFDLVYRLTLENGKAILYHRDKTLIDKKDVEESFVLDESAMQDVRRMYDELGLDHVKAETDDAQILDAPDVTVTFRSQGDSVSFEQYGYIMPGESGRVFHDLRELFEEMTAEAKNGGSGADNNR